MGQNRCAFSASGGNWETAYPEHSIGLSVAKASAAAIRVFVVSGVRLLREGVVRGFARRNDIVLVGCADFSPTELATIEQAKPQVIVVDLASHEGLIVGGMVRSLAPAAKVVAFSLTEAEESVLACAAAGFSGYVTRDAGIDDMLQAVRDACVGRLTCTPQMAASMFNHLSRMLTQPTATPAPPHLAAAALTSREQQIVALLNEGQSNKEIARQLQISPATVKNHIHNLLQKLKVERRAQAVAQMRGPVPPAVQETRASVGF